MFEQNATVKTGRRIIGESCRKVFEDWRILVSAARVYNQIPKWGMIIDDEFVRESRSGGGRQVNTRERDRVKSLSLMEQALNVSVNEEDKKGIRYILF